MLEDPLVLLGIGKWCVFSDIFGVDGDDKWSGIADALSIKFGEINAFQEYLRIDLRAKVFRKSVQTLLLAKIVFEKADIVEGFDTLSNPCLLHRALPILRSER